MWGEASRRRGDRTPEADRATRRTPDGETRRTPDSETRRTPDSETRRTPDGAARRVWRDGRPIILGT